MGEYKIFKPLKSDREFTKKICGFDVETYQEEKNMDGIIPQKFLCGSVFGDDVEFFTKDKAEFGNFLLSRKLKDYYIYATNLEFDFIHTFQETPHFPKFRLIDRGAIIYAKHKENNHIHEFLDTYNYTGKIKLEQMGDYLKIPKLKQPVAFTKIPKDAEEWKEMREYNINDSRITYEFAKFFCRDFCKKINALPKITIASTGMDFWRRNFQKNDIFQEPRDIIERHYEGSIHGGRTECIIRGHITDKFYAYDFNSHYPARCFEGIDGKGSYPLPSSWHHSFSITTEIIETYEGITKCSLKAPYMHIPVLGFTNTDGKYIFPVGNIPMNWHTNIEIRLALDNGYELISIEEGIYYTDTFIPFRGAIKFLYELRKEYTAKNDILMSSMLKTLMNSGMFGKFAQKITGKSEIVHENNVFSDFFGRLYAIIEEEKKYYSSFSRKGDIFICKDEGSLHIPIFIQPILASYTTALGRIKLFSEISKIAKDVLYYDTDSVMSFKNRFEDSKELGELKLEYSSKDAVFVKPKFYRINDGIKEKIKVKGLGKKPDKSLFDGILDGKEVDYTKFTRFKEGKTRNIGFSYIIPTHKAFTLEDTKREWRNKFNPYKMEESTPLSI